MQHTQNYQLSRWEKDDRIMMEDFNADNEAIDAALAAKADAEDVTALGETVAVVAAVIDLCQHGGQHGDQTAGAEKLRQTGFLLFYEGQGPLMAPGGREEHHIPLYDDFIDDLIGHGSTSWEVEVGKSGYGAKGLGPIPPPTGRSCKITPKGRSPWGFC